MFIFPDNYCKRKGNHCGAINWLDVGILLRTQEISGGLNLEYDNRTETGILLTCVLTNLGCDHKV